MHKVKQIILAVTDSGSDGYHRRSAKLDERSAGRKVTSTIGLVASTPSKRWSVSLPAAFSLTHA